MHNGCVTQCDSLPTIDVSVFATGARPSADRDPVARQIDETCREIGFFLLTGPGIDADAKQAMLASAAEFFALPTETKQAIAIEKPGCRRGYVGIAAEILDAATGGDLKETLDTGSEHGPDHPEVRAGVPLFGPNQLPDLPGSARPGTPTAPRRSRRRHVRSGPWPGPWGCPRATSWTSPGARPATT